MSAVALVTQTPDVDGTKRARRRRVIDGVSTERLPARACAGAEVGPQPVAEPPALQLTRRGKAVLTIVSVLVFGAAVAVLGLRVAGVWSGVPEMAGTVPVQVGAGESLWSIAQETNPGQDPRMVVEQIADLNGLSAATDVTPGSTLQIPVFR
ncbi:LysM peptidoglycan-binding domain-containing protein [Kribbella sp. NBC_01245]|uniref:LysM peptidoglycan-binding domain-containing protein n=1 Tax=Kribbella sp. NBC_01245 TaxID=2903578 RepID=UPI002E2BC26C|nr:LysM peptidoglycan-binding domain-containing protein [Kribbella sp. NBC_01245]